MSLYQWFESKIPGNAMPNSEYLYGLRHISIIILCVAAIVILTLLLRKKSEEFKTKFFKNLSYVFLFFEILYRIVKMIFLEDYSIMNILRQTLPLFFCSIIVWIMILALLLNKKTLINVGAIGGFLATTAYLVLPLVGMNQKIITFDAFYSIFTHCLGFVTSYLLFTTGHVKLQFDSYYKTLIVFGIIYVYGMFASIVVFPNSDFLFAINNPLKFDFIIPYSVVYILVVIAYITTVYYISHLVYRKKEIIQID